jgi:hypothetical protein
MPNPNGVAVAVVLGDAVRAVINVFDHGGPIVGLGDAAAAGMPK